MDPMSIVTGVVGAAWLLAGAIGEVWLLLRIVRNLFNSSRDPKPGLILMDTIMLVIGWPLIVVLGMILLAAIGAMAGAGMIH